MQKKLTRTHTQKNVNKIFHSNSQKSHSPFKQYSNTQIWLCVLSVVFFFFFSPCTLSACVHHCTHACGWHRARIFVCSHSVSIINGRKLIQFIAFTYWPESLLQGGIMAAWVCTKTGEEKGRVEEGEGEGKKMETCPYRKHIGATRWRLFTYWDKIKPAVGWIFYQTVKKQLNSHSTKKIGEMGIYRYEYI